MRLVGLSERFDGTDAEFAAQHGVNVGTLRVWRWRLRSEAVTCAPPPQSEPRLLPVVVAPPHRVGASMVPATAPQVLEASLPGGLVIRVPVGADVEYVARLLKDLSRC